ncbi:MAG: capreomycidine synthase [Pyrinomonadaceae bacterium]
MVTKDITSSTAGNYSAMNLPPVELEVWLREYYFDNDIDMSSSGVEDFSMAEIRELVGLTQDDFDRIVFHDSRTLGAPGLREAIAQRFANGKTDLVMATHGSSEAIFLIMHALLRAGDEVVIVDPCYPHFAAIAEAIGCQLKHWPLRFERQFVPDIEEAKSLLNSRTRMVVVNFPHNPTGASVTPEAQQELIDAVAKVGAYLVWDGAFAEMTYQQPRLPEASLLYDRAISMGTLSKAYGLPGLRVGWFLAPPEVLDRCVHLRDYTTLHLSPLVELIAQRVIEKADRLVEIRRRQARTNLEVLSNWMDENRGFIEWVPPKGGVCVFPRLSGIANIVDFCHHLARVYRVLLVPGTCFRYAEHVRLGFGGSTQGLQEGLSRLSSMLRTYGAKASE